MWPATAFAHEERAAEVYGDDPEPSVGDDVEKPRPAAGCAAAESGGAGIDAGVVDQDVECAHFGNGALHRVLNGIRVGYVGDDGQDGVITAQFAHVVGGLIQPVFVDIEHGDASAGANEAGCDGPAHADGAGRAGHDGDAALQGVRWRGHGYHLMIFAPAGWRRSMKMITRPGALRYVGPSAPRARWGEREIPEGGES